VIRNLGVFGIDAEQRGTGHFEVGAVHQEDEHIFAVPAAAGQTTTAFDLGQCLAEIHNRSPIN
jgi:hypothetical protein